MGSNPTSRTIYRVYLDKFGIDVSVLDNRFKASSMQCKFCEGTLTKPWQKKFCSRSCAAKCNNIGRIVTEEHRAKVRQTFLSKNPRVASDKKKRESVVSKSCLECGIEFKPDKNARKFCSMRCFSSARSFIHLLRPITIYLGSRSPVRVNGPYIVKHGRSIVVVFYDDGTKKSMSLARHLMQEKLKRELAEWETVDHIDEDPTNNDVENFQILTLLENVQKSNEAVKAGKKAKKPYAAKMIDRLASRERLRTSNPTAKLNANIALEIRLKFADGLITYWQIMKNYGVNSRSVRNVLSGKTYAYVGGPIFEGFAAGRKPVLENLKRK